MTHASFTRPGTPDQATITRSIACLGEPGFHQALFEVLGQAAELDMLSVFSFGAAQPPRFCFAHAQSPVRRSFAAEASSRYASLFWQSDPALHHAGAAPAVSLRRQSWQQIPESDYRVVCYERPAVVDRVSLCGPLGEQRVVVNVYRQSRQGMFGPDELEALASCADLVLAMTSRHLHIGELKKAHATRPDAAAFESRLEAACPMLSRRERAVCAGVLAGLSVKEVASAMALEASSVITYKRRAYAKLQVTDSRGLAAAFQKLSLQ